MFASPWKLQRNHPTGVQVGLCTMQFLLQSATQLYWYTCRAVLFNRLEASPNCTDYCANYFLIQTCCKNTKLSEICKILDGTLLLLLTSSMSTRLVSIQLEIIGRSINWKSINSSTELMLNSSSKMTALFCMAI